jgi:ElaB/YqjD/DUF883 family membrane-anchored ribosome-binding protein
MTNEDRMTTATNDISGAIKEKAEDIKDTVGEYYERGIDKAREIEAGLENYVRDNPMRSILIAAGISLGAGLLIGALIKR